MFVGLAKWQWQGDWVFEPDECFGEGEFEVTQEEWDELDFPMTCTDCGAELDPFCDHFTAEDGETSGDVYNRTIADVLPVAQGEPQCS